MSRDTSPCEIPSQVCRLLYCADDSATRNNAFNYISSSSQSHRNSCPWGQTPTIILSNFRKCILSRFPTITSSTGMCSYSTTNDSRAKEDGFAGETRNEIRKLSRRHRNFPKSISRHRYPFSHLNLTFLDLLEEWHFHHKNPSDLQTKQLLGLNSKLRNPLKFSKSNHLKSLLLEGCRFQDNTFPKRRNCRYLGHCHRFGRSAHYRGMSSAYLHST